MFLEFTNTKIRNIHKLLQSSSSMRLVIPDDFKTFHLFTYLLLQVP